MVTCFLRYIIDATKLNEFEAYGRMWIPLVEKFGGKHGGYLLPSEGASNVALAIFTFPSLAEYEQYRQRAAVDPDCLAAIRQRDNRRPFCKGPAGMQRGREELGRSLRLANPFDRLCA
jgi:uncharacterized protein (DUF1330 family)